MKGGVEVLIPVEVSDDVKDDHVDNPRVVAEVLDVGDVSGFMSDSFVAGGPSSVTDVARRGIGERSVWPRPGRAAQKLGGLVVDTAGAALAGPREGAEELELRGGGVIEEDVIAGDVIEEPVGTGDIEAVGVVVGDLNKSLKSLFLVMCLTA